MGINTNQVLGNNLPSKNINTSGAEISPQPKQTKQTNDSTVQKYVPKVFIWVILIFALVFVYGFFHLNAKEKSFKNNSPASNILLKTAKEEASIEERRTE